MLKAGAALFLSAGVCACRHHRLADALDVVLQIPAERRRRPDLDPGSGRYPDDRGRVDDLPVLRVARKSLDGVGHRQSEDAGLSDRLKLPPVFTDCRLLEQPPTRGPGAGSSFPRTERSSPSSTSFPVRSSSRSIPPPARSATARSRRSASSGTSPSSGSIAPASRPSPSAERRSSRAARSSRSERRFRKRSSSRSRRAW
jgi:hypothetical protein